MTLNSHSKFPEGFFDIGFDPLSDQVAYPYLDEAEIAEVAPFGERCAFAENDPLFSAGDYPFKSYVILSGKVRAVDVSTGERVVFVRYGAGYFTGDIDLLTRRPTIVSVEAETSIQAVRSVFSNPQSNPQSGLSCTTSAYFGGPRALVSYCKA